jgi:hypothetical protein
MTIPKTPGGAAMLASTYQKSLLRRAGEDPDGTRIAPDIGSPMFPENRLI